MNFNYNKDYDGYFFVNWFDPVGKGDEFSLTSNMMKSYKTNFILRNSTKILELTDEISCEDENIKIKKYFKYRNTCTAQPVWSEQLPIEKLIGLELDPDYDFELELFYYLDFTIPSEKKIYVNNIKVRGEYDIEVEHNVAVLDNKHREVLVEFYDIYKIFKIENVEVVGCADTDYTIYFRITQNQGRTWSQWSHLSLENLQNTKIDKLRFCNIQYLIKLVGFPKGRVMIEDIIIMGDVQNISADYKKLNRIGLREECLKSKNNGKLPDNIHSGQLNDCPYDPYTELLSQKKDNYLNLYDTEKIPKFAELLSGQISDLLGWDVKYFHTDPDGNGIDYAYHQYTLKNISQMGDVKIVVPQNKFKQDNIMINKYNLDLFDTFEVHVTKDAFKSAFGIEKRPRKNDILYLCETNKIYDVEHTFPFKGPMNTTIYYRLMLKKHVQNDAINVTDQTSKDLLDTLTKNTTIDSILGLNTHQEEDKVANIEQTYPLSFEKTRQKIFQGVNMFEEKLYNQSIDFAHYNYSFRSIENGKLAIDYKINDNKFENGFNRNFIAWFKINSFYSDGMSLTDDVFDNYFIDEKTRYNLLCNFHLNNPEDREGSGRGYRIWVNDKKLKFQINNYETHLETDILRNIWYSAVVNLNQRSGKVELYIFRRRKNIEVIMYHPETYQKLILRIVDKLENAFDPDDPTYTYTDALNDGYLPVDNIETEEDMDFDIGNESNDCVYYKTQEANSCDNKDNFVMVGKHIDEKYQSNNFNHNQSIRIKGSDISYTNLRIFNECIEREHLDNILNELIIKNAESLILADNANEEIHTTNYWNKNFS